MLRKGDLHSHPPTAPPRRVVHCPARKSNAFSPFELLTPWRSKVDPIAEAVGNMPKEYEVQLQEVKKSTTKASDAEARASKSQSTMEDQHAAVEKLLDNVQELNRGTKDSGLAKCMLVDVELTPSDLNPSIQELVQQTRSSVLERTPVIVDSNVVVEPPPRVQGPVAEPEREQQVEQQEEVQEQPQVFPSSKLPPAQSKDRKAEGNGSEIMLQAFNWESHKGNYYQVICDEAHWFASMGFTYVWLPPPTASVSPEGYMPTDYFNLNSNYGSEADLRRAVAALKQAGLKVAGDCVLNHRCALHQDENGIWNRFGGRLDWDALAVCGDDREFHGRGNPSTGDMFPPAPNVDHTQQFVRDGISDWLRWLRSEIGIDGYRLDYVRGFGGEFVREYCERTEPDFVVGEYWDSLAYDGNRACHNQDRHRQQIVDWINAAGGQATAFDVTTKGILHEVFNHSEYWRLRDASGAPPGVMGWWPSRATTFLENHDTGSTQAHWQFPPHGLQQGYCYILTHPGTPTVFYDHIKSAELTGVISRLLEIRCSNGLHVRSHVDILVADDQRYAARIDDKVVIKIGHGAFHPGDGWREAAAGDKWCVWQRA